jgi:hypothetical protein
MKNFISRIECVVEPSLYHNEEGENVQITMRCRANDTEWSISKIEDLDFLKSNFDLIFDHMRDSMKYKFLDEVQSNG